MGVKLKQIVVKEHVSFKDLKYKVLAFDAYNIIYQFLSTIRQYDGKPLMDAEGNITAHLTGLLYRNTKFLQHGIKPVFVFDGKPPDLKFNTSQVRNERKVEAQNKYNLALKDKNYEEARKFARQTSRLTKDMVTESIELMNAMGIPCVRAPSEGEAQAAWMADEGYAYASVSQDMDSLLFGSPKLIRNLSITGKRKLPGANRYVNVEPEMILLSETLAGLNITREKLVWVGLMVGTDYNQGVHRVGQKTGLKIVSQLESLEELISYLKREKDYVFEEDPYKLVDLFLNPKVTDDFAIKFGKPNVDKIYEILVEMHDFDQKRVNNAIEKMVIADESIGQQTGLGDFV